MTEYSISVVTETFTDYTIEAESVVAAIHWAVTAAREAAEGDSTLPDGVRLKGTGYSLARATHASPLS